MHVRRARSRMRVSVGEWGALAPLAIVVLQVVGVLTSLSAYAVSALLTSWIVMVALGILHRQVPAVPALGWAATFGLLLALEVVASAAWARVVQTATSSDED